MFPQNALGQYFEEIGSDINIALVGNGHYYGDGVSFRDLNGDGLDDLTFVRQGALLRIFLSTETGFIGEQTNIFCPPGSIHLLWVDYDNDGDDDAFLTSFGGVSRLFRNNGNFDFEDVTESSGLPLTSDFSYGASFGDYNRDGHLDLYLCRYYPDPQGPFKENALFRNNGDGTFSDVTESAGVGDGSKASFMGVWADFNNDMWPDLYVINDRDPANSLYMNNGDGTFTDITVESGTGFPMNDPMSATVGDYNNDGYSDIFMSNNGSDVSMPPLLLTNNGNSTFSETAADMGIFAPAITWGALWADFDNDGSRDLFYTAAGFTTDYFYLNEGGISFTHLPSQGISPPAQSYTCAKGDFDNDGYVDIAVGNLAPAGPTFYKNVGGVSYYIKIKLQGTISNRDAVGTKVRVHRGPEVYHHFTQCGENFMGQDSQTMIFGLGDDPTGPDSVKVTYPSGHTDIYTNLSVNETHQLTEGETYSVSINNQGVTALCPGDSTILDAGEHDTYLWNTGESTRFITAFPGGFYEVEVTSPQGITATDQVTIEALPEVSVIENVQHPTCFETPTGEITLANQSDPTISSVIWNTDLSGPEIDSLYAGVYSYLLTDSNGCTAEGTLSISDPPELTLFVFINPEVNGDDGSIFITVFGGTPPYEITINGAPAALSNYSLAGGDYLVFVNDVFGCSAEYTAELTSTLDTKSIGKQSLSVYPNPTYGPINLRGAESALEWRIMDSNGRVCLKSKSNGECIDISHLSSGAYTLRISMENSSEIVTFKIFKQ